MISYYRLNVTTFNAMDNGYLYLCKRRIWVASGTFHTHIEFHLFFVLVSWINSPLLRLLFSRACLTEQQGCSHPHIIWHQNFNNFATCGSWTETWVFIPYKICCMKYHSFGIFFLCTFWCWTIQSKMLS